MTVAEVGVICSIAFGLIGFLISYVAFQRGKKKEETQEGENRGAMASDIGYIKAGVDDLKRETRETRAVVGELTERVTRVEESCKQAHHRIDEIRVSEKGE